MGGDGPFDVIFVPRFVTHVELQWRLPGMGDFIRGLGSFSRLIRFDKRGTGMSDPVSGAPSLETRMDDGGIAAGRVLRPVGGRGDEHPVRRDLSRTVRSAMLPHLCRWRRGAIMARCRGGVKSPRS